ncbi:MAG: hypothetical protein QM719_07155 [Thermomonas sp.]
MSIATDLLFLHGHIVDPSLARDLAAAPSVQTNPQPEFPMKTSPNSLFKSLWYLGGLDDLDLRIGLDEEAYGPTFGNRVAARRTFDTYARRRERRDVAKPAVAERSAISCA